MRAVLITGMSGLIGGALRRHLEALGGYDLRALNRRKVAGVPTHQADIGELEDIKAAFAGIDTVVHLAAHLGDEPWESLLRANLVGTYNIYEAARLAGVKRVVFASSGSTIRGYEGMAPYDAIAEGRYEDAPEQWPMITHEMTWPNGTYGASKIWGEALGRHYSDSHGLSVLCVRIGAVPADDRPRTARDFSVYLSHQDVTNILHRCIEAPESVRYDIFFALSNNRWGYRDLEHPRQVLGFVPQDSAESFR